MIIFKYILIIFASLIFSTQSYAENNNFQDTVNQLSAKKLSSKLKVIESIIDSNNPKVEFVLQSLLKSEVYYLKSNKKIVHIKKDNKEYLAKDLLSGNALGRYSKRQIKKVGINNKIRQKIKIGLSILSLNSKDASIRLKSVKSIYNNIDQKTYEKVKKIIDSEKNSEVHESMSVLINLYQLNDESASVRIKSIENLDSSLESVVRNKLVKILDNDKSPDVRLVAERSLKDIDSKISFFKNLETVFLALVLGQYLSWQPLALLLHLV